MKEYVKMLKNTFNYKGRARRREYWVPSFINSAISCFIFGIMFLAATIAGDCLWYNEGGAIGYQTAGSVAATIAYIPFALFSVYSFIVGLSLGVRRFHDAGFAAWAYVLCLVGYCCCGIGAIVQLVFTLLNSKEDNQWGANPKVANPDEYTGATSIVVSIVLAVVAMVILMVCMFVNMSLDPSVLYI